MCIITSTKDLLNLESILNIVKYTILYYIKHQSYTSLNLISFHSNDILHALTSYHIIPYIVDLLYNAL